MTEEQKARGSWKALRPRSGRFRTLRQRFECGVVERRAVAVSSWRCATSTLEVAQRTALMEVTRGNRFRRFDDVALSQYESVRNLDGPAPRRWAERIQLHGDWDDTAVLAECEGDNVCCFWRYGLARVQAQRADRARPSSVGSSSVTVPCAFPLAPRAAPDVAAVRSSHLRYPYVCLGKRVTFRPCEYAL